MRLRFSKQAGKAYQKLSPILQKKADKQFAYLKSDFHHPSLMSKRMSGVSYYEARIDYHYRFVFSVNDELITIITLGPHDTGLGKK